MEEFEKEKQELIVEMLESLFEQGDISWDELQQAKREGNVR